MRLLIDTHAFVWSLVRTGALSASATEAISSLDNEVLISAVSAYEIDYKRPFDPELQSLPVDLNEAVVGQQFRWLDVEWRHAREAARLPRHHRDPWDRILVAQARLEGLTLVTADKRIASYGVPVLW